MSKHSSNISTLILDKLDAGGSITYQKLNRYTRDYKLIERASGNKFQIRRNTPF